MHRLPLLAALALAACDRAPDVRQAAAERAAPAYDADSASRGLLPPAMAALLAVEPLLDGPFVRGGTRADARRCLVDTLAQLRHETVRFDVRAGDTATTVFARRTPEGELRRVEVLQRWGGGTGLGAAWDASTRSTTTSEFTGTSVRRTVSRDFDAPLARAMRYVGRRVLARGCGER